MTPKREWTHIGLLTARFPQVAAHYTERGSGRVGILVDTLDHGLVLAAQLGWPLVAAADINEQGLSAEQQTILQRGRHERHRICKPVVVTGAGMARAGRFDYVIRADGGTGLPPIPACKLRVRHGQDRRLLLIDFVDRYHPLLRQWSQQRRQAYCAAGWSVAGVDLSPLDRFLATRPEVQA
jgi:hypothetical protein